jgi:rubrerythrin
VDKLSDHDYQTSKLELQKELARVLAETDRIKAEMGQPSSAKAAPAPVAKPGCPKCGARFESKPKFCPECGAAQ